MHGGGPQISAMLDRLGIKSSSGRPAGHHARGDGRRPDGARRPGQPRAGRADQLARPARRRAVRRGRRPVHRRAAGTVVDGEEVDLGLVGDVVEVRPEAVIDLIDAGRIPVVSSVAPDADGLVHNVNADTAAAALAVALGPRSSSCSPTSRASTRDWPDSDDVIQRDQPDDARGACCRAWIAAWCRRWRPASRRPRRRRRGRTSIDGRVPHSVLLEIVHRRGRRHPGGPGWRTRLARQLHANDSASGRTER